MVPLLGMEIYEHMGGCSFVAAMLQVLGSPFRSALPQALQAG
jgi:hypothetical protein